MLVSCSYCNGLHSRGFACPSRPKNNRAKKEDTYISRFRSLRVWQKKRIEIKKRDKYLCQACLLDSKYTFNNLEVHHIYSISEKWNKRLDSKNLITLCTACHKLAENGNIKRSVLLKIAENADAL